MPIREDLLTKSVFAGFRRPVLGECDEELLFGRKAALGSPRCALERSVIAVEGGGDARNVGDVLSERLLTIESEVGERLIGAVLFGEGLGSFLEVLEVGGGPPIAHSALGV